MAGKLENILQEGQCIPEDLLMKYMVGKCTPEENHVVEKHLLGCEFCTEALEGLRFMNPSRSASMVDELNNKIDARIEEEGKNKPVIIPFRMNYKIAAVITLFILFAGGYFFLKNKVDQKTLAENKAVPVQHADSAQQQFVPRSTEAEKPAEPINSAPIFSLKEKSAAGASKKIAPPVNTQKTESNSKVIDNDAVKQINDNSLAQNEAKNNIGEDAEKDIEESKEEVKTSSSGAAAPAATENVAYSKMNRTRSVVDQKEVSGDNTSPGELFSEAKANYDLKKYEEAENDFEKLLNDTASKYYDDSKWYLAVCYSKTHKNAKARKLLREIAHSTSIHKKEAEGLLQE